MYETYFIGWLEFICYLILGVCKASQPIPGSRRKRAIVSSLYQDSLPSSRIKRQVTNTPTQMRSYGAVLRWQLMETCMTLLHVKKIWYSFLQACYEGSKIINKRQLSPSINICKFLSYSCGPGMRFQSPSGTPYYTRSIQCNWNRTWTPTTTLDSCVFYQCINPPVVCIVLYSQHLGRSNTVELKWFIPDH